MRNLTWWLAASALLATLGCSGSGSPVTAPQTSPDSAALPQAALSASGALGTPFINGDLATAALAIYTVDIDPVSMQATSRLKETRTVAANDDLYLLSIDSFLNAGSFAITGITATATTIDLGYVVKHPFPAPNNPTGTPNGSTNRADLGVAGMVLFMADVPSASGNTYFTDRVANTDLVANADAYFSPGGLLTTSGTANTYPYKQLVDERNDPRVGVSNGGDVTGNFGSDGWTRSEFGAGNNGWTGYGVMHQGQSVTNTMSLNKTALSGGFSLDVSIIAVYNDPRGGATAAQKKANRLPPASPDASLFAYRMPHGALDVGKISVLAETAGFIANTISAQTMSFLVEDWDARATETSEADLANDSSFTNVAQGESGTPTLDVCIPDVLGDATFTADASTVVDDDSGLGGDVDQDSGRPGDALYYSTVVTKAAGSGQVAGFYKGMVRASDPQVGLTIGLNESLAPLPSTPDPVTYQALTVEMLPDNEPPTATVAVTTPIVTNGGPVSISVNSLADTDDDPIDILVDWDDDGTYTLATTVNSPYPGAIPLTSPINYTFSGPAPDIRDLPVRLFDGTAQVDIAPTPTFEVESCPNLANSGTNVVGGGTWLGYYNWAGFGGTQQFPLDAATYPIAGAPAGPLGAYVTQINATGVAANPMDLVIMIPNMALTAPNPAGYLTNYIITNYGAAYTQRFHQIEVDRTGRILFAAANPTYPATGQRDITAIYNPAQGTEASFRWFDWAGGPPVAPGSINSVSTGSGRVIAMALDGNNDVYIIDHTHKLRKFEKATNYTEVTTTPFPLDLVPIIGADGGVTAGDANRKVIDFIVNWRNRNFFILVGSRGTAPNTRLYRIECNGTFNATIEGNPNPHLWTMTTNTTQNYSADITIDQLDSTGAPLATQGEAQILVGGGQLASGGTSELYYFNTKLQRYQGTNALGTTNCGFLTRGLDNNIFFQYSGGPQWMFVNYGLPTGWQ